MFQTFTSPTSPDQGPPRLQRLREEMETFNLTGFLVPRADAFQGEYVAAHDERLAWLSGFTGSAGFCVVLGERAGLFVDGRYRVQARQQAAPAFDIVNWPETKLADWLRAALPRGGTIGLDPWLHTVDALEKLVAALKGSDIRLKECPNLIDRIWDDQPAPPKGAISVHDLAYAGVSHQDKRAELSQALHEAGDWCTVLTQPDSIAWLLNIRGSDIPRVPVPHVFAILHNDGRVTVYGDPEKYSDAVRAHLGDDITLRPVEAFGPGLRSLIGPVALDKTTTPLWVAGQLAEADIEVNWSTDPCALPKACKNPVEIAGAVAANLRDSAAMCEFLAWLDQTAPHGELTEIDVVTELELSRRNTDGLCDISFDTIAGSGPNGAIVHYRVTRDTNRRIRPGDLLLIDSGGQYRDGTTDLTRTVAIGPPGDEERACFTRVLQGMIAMSCLRFPRGLAGRDIDAIARMPLWLSGLDYDHGTGHGVGSYLSVHEGPQRLSRLGETPLRPGMILSNEPGYYREGAFGIRIENLITVQEADPLEGGDDRAMYGFSTLTLVPIDRTLINPVMLNAEERTWLDAYHAHVRTVVGPHLSEGARDWLTQATAPL